MLETTIRTCFSNVSFLSNNTPRSLNEWPLINKFGCGGFMVLERLTTIEVDLRGFKLIPHEPHHNLVLDEV